MGKEEITPSEQQIMEVLWACGIFLRADWACDAAPEGGFFKTDIHKGTVMVILPVHPVSWKAEAVLRKCGCVENDMTGNAWNYDLSMG